MFLWYPVLDLARAPRRTARKKGSGYENGRLHDRATIDYIECKISNYILVNRLFHTFKTFLLPVETKPKAMTS
jgi:hypothetical protein